MNSGRLQHISPIKPLIFLLFIQFPQVSLSEGFFFGGISGGVSHSSVLESPLFFTPELRIARQVTDLSSVEVSGAFGAVTRSFDTPSGPAGFPIRVAWIEAYYNHTVLPLGESAKLTGSVGLGITQMSHDEISFQAGPVGLVTLPDQSETRGHLSGGLRVSRKISGTISASIGTTLRMLTPVSHLETIYSVHGGITIEIR